VFPGLDPLAFLPDRERRTLYIDNAGRKRFFRDGHRACAILALAKSVLKHAHVAVAKRGQSMNFLFSAEHRSCAAEKGSGSVLHSPPEISKSEKQILDIIF
jgi:hypothetical protein